MELNSIALAFLIANVGLILVLPRRLAALPLLLGACYMTRAQGIEIGPFSFTCLRILVAVGFVRVIARRESMAGGMNSLDGLMLIWACWFLFSSQFHKDPSGMLVTGLGIVYSTCGIYFLIRVFCQSLDDLVWLCRFTVIILVPLAIEMLSEKITGHNFFSMFGEVRQFSAIRGDKIRAQGPFAHAILAGTVGAVCLPFAIALWRQYRKEAVAGIAACLVMIFASASSGPIMSCFGALCALFMWHWRDRMRFVRWCAVFGYIALDIYMNDPAYYIIARIDLTGSSTGWHRAYLIQSAFEHLSEWWLWGTDYTRHWMPLGILWSEDHTDITNHYLYLGVFGGLPLMLLFIVILVKGFSFVGQTLQQGDSLPFADRFMVWSFGAALFTHAATCTSIAYTDQSFVFVYLTLGAIGSMRSATMGTVGYPA